MTDIVIVAILFSLVGFGAGMAISAWCRRRDRADFMDKIQERVEALAELEKRTQQRYRELRVKLGLPPDLRS